MGICLMVNRVISITFVALLSLQAMETAFYSARELASRGAFRVDPGYDDGVKSLLKRFRRSSPFDDFDHLFDFKGFDFGGPPQSGNTHLGNTQAATQKKKKKKKKEGQEKEKKRAPQPAEIPAQTRDEFTPPKIKNKRDRQEKYQRLAPVGNLDSASFLVHNEPFFETFNHKPVVLGLNRFRRANHIPFVKLLSIRPFFPFFVKT